jgi:hypothetical protein
MSTNTRTASLVPAGRRLSPLVESGNRLAARVKGPRAGLLRKIGASLLSILREAVLMDARLRERREHDRVEFHRAGGYIRYF